MNHRSPACQAVLALPKQHVDAADEIQSKYGTIEMFSEGLGIDATKQKALSGLYLERK